MPAAPPQKLSPGALVAILLVFVALVGGILLYRRATGGEMGAACKDGMGCKPGMICAGVCTARCSSASECPAGWTCGALDVKHLLGAGGVEIGKSEIQACLPPGMGE